MLQNHEDEEKKKHDDAGEKSWFRFAAVIIIVITMIVGGYFLFRNNNDTTTTTPANNNDNATTTTTAATGSSGLSAGGIVGVVVGIIAFLLIVASLYRVFRRRRKSSETPKKSSEEMSELFRKRKTLPTETEILKYFGRLVEENTEKTKLEGYAEAAKKLFPRRLPPEDKHTGIAKRLIRAFIRLKGSRKAAKSLTKLSAPIKSPVEQISMWTFLKKLSEETNQEKQRLLVEFTEEILGEKKLKVESGDIGQIKDFLKKVPAEYFASIRKLADAEGDAQVHFENVIEGIETSRDIKR